MRPHADKYPFSSKKFFIKFLEPPRSVFSPIDLLTSLASLVGQPLPKEDGENAIDVLLGKSQTCRKAIVWEGIAGLAVRAGEWKYITPLKGNAEHRGKRTDNSPQPKLYHLTADRAENHNLAEQHLEKVTDLAVMIEAIIGGSA